MSNVTSQFYQTCDLADSVLAAFLVLIQFQAISCWSPAQKILYHFLFQKLLDNSQDKYGQPCNCVRKNINFGISKEPQLSLFRLPSLSIISSVNYVLASMSSVRIIHESGGVLVRGWLSDTSLFLFLRDSVSHFKLNLSGTKTTSELGQWAHLLLVSLTPPGVTPELFQLVLCASRILPWQSKTTVAAQATEWQVLMCDPRKSKYFN